MIQDDYLETTFSNHCFLPEQRKYLSHRDNILVLPVDDLRRITVYGTLGEVNLAWLIIDQQVRNRGISLGQKNFCRARVSATW